MQIYIISDYYTERFGRDLMVKVRAGDEAPPAAPPTLTLTPTLPHTTPTMGVPPSPASSFSASGPVSPASSINSTGDTGTIQEDSRPYSQRGGHTSHGYQTWAGRPPSSRRHSPHRHHHHHYQNNYQNGSGSLSYYHNHHQNGSGGPPTHHNHYYHHSNGHHHNHHHHHHHNPRGHHHYHYSEGGGGGGYHSYQTGHHKNTGYQDSYHGGYHSSYHGYSGRGRHKGSRDDSWVGSLSVGRGRGGGGRFKSISPTPTRSRGASPRPHHAVSQSFTPTLEESLGSITVEVVGSGGLVSGIEDGLGMGLPGEDGQHVVHLHINPGTTVNFTMEDGHVQRISGPASVRMVSNNSSPPIPLPVQVPPGHVVQQIVDETGTLRHVILSAQPVPMPMCPYSPNPGPGAPPFYGPPPPGPPPPGYVQTYQPPPQYSPVMSPTLTQPSPPPHYSQKNERPLRQFEKVRPSKYYHRQAQPPHNKSGSSSLHSTPPASPKKEPLPRKNGAEEDLQQEDGEDTTNTLQHLLSQVKQPKVLELGPHEAVIQWAAPDLSGYHEEIPISELRYEVFLNNGSYKTISTTQITISGLKPGGEYRVYFQCICGNVRGESSGVTPFQAHSTVPDAPQLPRLVNRTKTSLQFKWGAVKDNGCRVNAFILELCSGNSSWTEMSRSRNKQATVSRLQPNTYYRVRVAAVNEHGKSEYSPETTACTSGVVPSVPQRPSLEEASVTSLSLGWIKRPVDEKYTLQMEDSLNGYGFLPVYNGHEPKFVCTGLRRNADYKFRLCSHNEEGPSPFSDIACYRTLPDRPKPPSCPTLKGRAKATKFTVSWLPPTDHGGSPVTDYKLEIDRGKGFECTYSGDKLETECTDLSPGSSYRIRVLCRSLGGGSEWSDIATVTTEAVCPGQCQPPRLLGKPKSSMLQLKWGHPEYDGGAAVTEFHIDMVAPDSDRRQVYCGRDLECTVASLLPGRPYIFMVRSVNRAGPGAWSEPLEVVSGAGPPDTPHSLHLACRSPHSVHLVWEEPINNGATIDQYSVQMAEVACLHAESSESSSTCGDPESDLTFSSAYTGSATTTEVRNLAPATTYAFRVSCSNSAGTGPWSAPATVTTPAAPPAPVAYISSSPAATSVTLLWSEPANHGDPITHYLIEVGDKTVATPGPETEYTLNDLLPETLYRMRIQAVNSVGPGSFSSNHKVTTRPLPPAPPTLELVKASYNSLRLKWGDGRNSDMLTYSLQMEFPNPHNGTKEFYQVYSGTNQNYKVVRLEENTEYRLRICANNEAGVGPFSPIAHLSTTKAPPPPLKAPRVTENTEGGHVVEWCSVRCPGDDSIVYRLQVLQAGKDQDYSLVFTGSETCYTLTDLEPQSGYFVRVCGVRLCGDGETMAGAYSSPTLFNTPKPAPVAATMTAANPTQEAGLHWHQLSDQQKACIILLAFSMFCAIAAIGLHHCLTPNSGR